MTYSPEYYNDLVAEERGYEKWEYKIMRPITEILARLHPDQKIEIVTTHISDDNYLNSKELVF